MNSSVAATFVFAVRPPISAHFFCVSVLENHSTNFFAAAWFFGIDPRLILGLADSASNVAPQPQAQPGTPTDEAGQFMAAVLGEFAHAGLLNIVGGCCGTTPEHIAAIGAAVAGVAPRELPQAAAAA